MEKKIRKICLRLIKDDMTTYEFFIDYEKWVDWCNENNLEQGFNSLRKFFFVKFNKNIYNELVQIEYLY